MPEGLRFPKLTIPSLEGLSISSGRTSTQDTRMRGAIDIHPEIRDHKSFLKARWKSLPRRMNTSSKGLIVSSIGLYTILPEGLRFPKLTILFHKGLSVTLGWISTQELRLRGATNIQPGRLDQKSCLKARWKSDPKRKNASPGRLIVSSVGLYIIPPKRIRFPRLTILSSEALRISSGGTSTQESRLRGTRDIQLEIFDQKSYPRAQ